MRALWMVLIGAAAIGIGAAQQDAKAFLRQVQQKYRNAKSWEMKIDITIETSFGDNSQKIRSISTVAMQTPNLMAAKIEASPPAPAREVYSDGETVYEYIPSAKQYIKRPAPPNFDGANRYLLGNAGILIGLLNEDLEKFDANVKIQFHGTQTVSGKQTRVVEISEKRGDSTLNLKLYIGAQDKLVYRAEWNQTTRMQQGGQGKNQAPLRAATKAVADIRYLSFDKPIAATRFRFKPPAGAKEVQPVPQQGQGGLPQLPAGSR